MSCHGNNATPPGPAISPGAESIDPMAAAVAAGRRGPDPRVLAAAPGFDAPFFQAGLAGYSDAAMRIIARRHGCPFCVTEALLDRVLLLGGRGFEKADIDLIQDNLPAGEEDLPLAGQIIGSDPDEMAAAAIKMIEQAARADAEYRRMSRVAGVGTPTLRVGSRPLPQAPPSRQHLRLPGGQQVGFWPPGESADDPAAGGAVCVVERCAPGSESRATQARPAAQTFTTIDVNLACPVKKIKNKSRGGHWLAEPQGAIDILRAVREAVPAHIPCTVKMRRGFDDSDDAARHFEVIFSAAYELGYAWATVHARTVEQKYIGPSRWPALAELVRRYPDRAIFGSGDVWSVADIFRMIAYTGVHAVAVARGCIGNPWIFRQARRMMAGESPGVPTVAEQRAVLEEHFRIAVVLNGEHMGSRMMRKFGIRFAAHHPRAEEVRKRMIAVASIEDWEAVLREFYSD